MARIESRLLSRPWYVSRFTLLCWEYLMIEAEAAGMDEAAIRAGFQVQSIQSGGPWHWRMRMMSWASPLAIPIGAPTFVILGGFWFAQAVPEWSNNPALAVGAAVAAVLCVVGALMLVFRRTPDTDVARRVWRLRDETPAMREATLKAWAEERLASDPGLYTATGLAIR